jgi:dCMP deaminase
VSQKIIDKWDNHFLQMALHHANLSKDPSTKVGAIIVGPERELISGGFNGLPRLLEDTEERLNNRDLKLQLVIHAEMNAILAAAKLGIKISGCTMYIVATDNTGEIWGGPPCTRCLVHTLQAGISQIITYTQKSVPSKWYDDIMYSKELIKEAGIIYQEIER